MVHNLVIAIDFGTSYSGYAFAYAHDKDVSVREQWPEQDRVYAKTPTHLFLDASGKVDSWGAAAEKRVAQLKRSSEASGYRFYKQFKMALHRLSAMPGGPAIEQHGKRVSVVSLMADYLRCLKNYALANIRDRSTGYIEDQDILWCLTVPAIWTDADKQRTREAAQMAGLIGKAEEDARRLTLVLEPEAAALQCLAHEKRYSFSELDVGTRFMVVDVGGGTVDITAHEVLANGELGELAPGTGGDCGSMVVDETFRKWLSERLNPVAIHQFQDDHLGEYVIWMSEWERLKCGYDPDSKIPTSFPIRPKLYNVLQRNYGDVLEKLRQTQEGEDENLVISHAEMAAIFEPSLNGIAKHVGAQLERIGRAGVAFVFLVGGYSASKLLQNRITKEFAGSQTRIVVPKTPGSAVLEGAVRYGLNPATIRARRARLTYGCRVNSPFEEGVDPPEKKWFNPDRNRQECTGRFDRFVARGASVAVDATVVKTLQPTQTAQTALRINFFATNRASARYCDEEGMKEIGMLECKMPDTTKGLERDVQITLRFGGTEIKAEAVDLVSGERATAQMKFSDGEEFTYFPDQIGS